MKIHLLDPESERHLVRAHTHDSVTIGNNTYSASLAVSPDTVISDWGPTSTDTLSQSHIAHLIDLKPELVLIGTGQNHLFPDLEILRPVIDKGIGYEIMATGAACRTYNVLVSEGRVVVAGLILSV